MGAHHLAASGGTAEKDVKVSSSGRVVAWAQDTKVRRSDPRSMNGQL